MEAEKKAEEERKAKEAAAKPGATIDVAVGTAGAFAATFDAARAATEEGQTQNESPSPVEQPQSGTWSWEQNVQQPDQTQDTGDHPDDPFSGGRFSG